MVFLSTVVLLKFFDLALKVFVLFPKDLSLEL